MKYFYIGLPVAIILLGGAYFGYREITLKDKLDLQQQAIGELQEYKNEQLRLAQEKIEQEEENKRIEEQNQIEQEARNKKQDCEDTKKYCSEEIVARKASVEDIKKQVKKDEAAEEEWEEDCKKSDSDEKKHACIKPLSISHLDEERKNLADQEKSLSNLVNDKCKNYQASCE